MRAPETAAGTRVAPRPGVTDRAIDDSHIALERAAWLAMLQLVCRHFDRLPGEAAGSTAGTATAKARPIQDEWGLYDPSQCGIPAVIAKLDALQQR